jgi:RNA-directed DNA polymerase
MEQLYLFDSLELEDIFENISNKSLLRKAFKEVKANKGCAGVDGQTIKEFEENLEEEINKLSEELNNWTYKPKPLKEKKIPKAGNKGERKLGIPSVRDRVVQQAIKMNIEWKYEQEFSESSYGFRPGRSQRKAIEKARSYNEEGYEWVVDIDLEKFFDKIPQDRLMTKLAKNIKDRKVLRLIGMILRSGIMTEEKEILAKEEGTTQGSPLSPLLSNIYLDELDKELEKRGHKFCRYADDCNIFCKSKKAATRIMKSITRFIEGKMKLKINKDKSKVEVSEKVVFLGMTIIKGTITISKKLMAKANDKISKLIPRNTNKTMDKLIKEANVWLRGWFEYVKITHYPAQIAKIEAHIRRKLRAKVIKQKKRRKNLYRWFVSKGIKKKGAFRDAYKKGETWAMSSTSSINKVLSNRWFENKGLIRPTTKELAHWKPLDCWIALI